MILAAELSVRAEWQCSSPVPKCRTQPQLAPADLRSNARGQHWGARNTLSPNGRSITLSVELRTRHTCLTDDVVEFAIGKVNSVRVWKLDLLAIVDPVVAVVAVVILNAREVSFDEVVIDFGNRSYLRHQDTLATFDPIDPVNRASIQMQKGAQGGLTLP